MPDTITIDAPLSADAARVYKGAKATPYVNAREVPAGTPDATPSISSAKVTVTLNRGEEAIVVFTASGAFVASRRVVAGRPLLIVDSVSPTTFARNTGDKDLTITGGPFLPVGSIEVFLGSTKLAIRSQVNDQIVARANSQGMSAGTYALVVARAGLKSNATNITVT